MSAGRDFKPRIVGFLCNWCCYGGADLAGVSRFQYPPYIRVIRVMCSGRVDLAHVFRAFSNGADGVFIGGCHLNDCHYNTEGNYDAKSMTQLCKKLLAHIGINPERLRLEWVSAGEGIRFAEIMNDFGNQVKKLGPLGTGEGLDKNELKSGIEAITKLIPYIKLTKREKLALHLPDEEEYNALYTSEEVDRLICEAPAYYINPDKCQACGICARRCPEEAIVGGKNLIHVIDQQKCIKCGTCLEACPPRFGAVTKIVGEPVPPPLPEEKRTIVRQARKK
ncbi:MAG: hydrogenase iron-sulfur subunit [Armatimonadetes bacterium]|nr:hydrogenase iron-sulfur subunit [Armatimonadota bacterium]